MKKSKRRIGNPNRDYAAEWREWRVRYGFTKVSLAFTLGVTRETIQNIESRRHVPRIDTRTKLRELQKRYEVEQWQPKQ